MNANLRKAIYAAVAGLVPLFVALGFLTDEQSSQILSSVAAALAFFASVMAMKNVNADGEPEGDIEFEELEFEDVTEGTEAPHIPGV
jgi:hypothetical protein